ncbi:MAG: glycerol-3-phosphate dehydrogenase [Chlorobi bacterium]|nr:glycerol-3-phosphate dehydrogenase [Chlorobiota bacterium]
MKDFLEIVFVGSGAISTALGNVLALKNKYNITLLSIEDEVVDSINNFHVNQKYFPNVSLHPKLKASTDKNILNDADVVFLGIPSNVTVTYVEENKYYFNPKALIVNLAKGFGLDNKTIPQCLNRVVGNEIFSMKGPSFAREIINNLPTGFTITSKKDKYFNLFGDMFENTSIYLDFTTDVEGVELASILKNIYAIIVGIVDAHFNSSNLRSLVLTKAINEMRYIISKFGGNETTLFNYCGFGDFSLTALNDLSRNRTLGLLIGKGFFTSDIPEKVVLEGTIAVNVFIEEIAKKRQIKTKRLMIKELYSVLNDENYDIKNFVNQILSVKRYKNSIFPTFFS